MNEEAVNWDDYLLVASQSDVGLRRQNNQDNLSISIASSLEQWRKHGHFFVVADGMGAHAAGELASKLAADNLSHLVVRNSMEPIDVCLRKSIEQTNFEIHRRGQANPEFFNMGTTCSSMALTPQGAVLGHVGDSRVYRLRGNRLEQLTFDHSLVWEMRASGQTKNMADGGAAIPKNVITRSLGPYPEVKVDVEGPFPVEPGDTFLLCSDGLTGPVHDDEIGSILAVLEPHESADALINLANLRGGPDNITVIVVRSIARVSGKGVAAAASHEAEFVSFPLIMSWVAFGVLVVGAVVAGLAAGTWYAILPAVLAAVALVAAIYVTFKQVKSGDAPEKNRTFGKAPYSQTVCPFNAEMNDRLKLVAKEVLQTAKDEQWKLDWNDIEKRLAAIEASVSVSQFRDAIAGHTRLINHIMLQVKKQR